MGMNDTPSSERLHIGFFGRRNAGKSSLVNAFTNQELSVVSEVRGTTTDPVRKSMELLPLGPVVIVDTPGFDDEGALGDLRVRKTRQVLNRIDIAILVVDVKVGLCACEEELLGLIREKELPYLIAYNKCDLLDGLPEEEKDAVHAHAEGRIQDGKPEEERHTVYVSATQRIHIEELKEMTASLVKESTKEKCLVRDLIKPGELVVLVIPIDKAAPKGRLILPQQMVVRDVLDAYACAVCVKENGLAKLLGKLAEKPSLVITDSQVFDRVSKEVPDHIPLTSFSILMARYKGFLDTAVEGAYAIKHLKDGDKILISEGCTHHRQCNDIGTVKLPGWLRAFTGAELIFETSSGGGFPEDLSQYTLIIHCGGCMLTEREMRYRMQCAQDQHIPITNYGTAIAFMHRILDRSLEVFGKL